MEYQHDKQLKQTLNKEFPRKLECVKTASADFPQPQRLVLHLRADRKLTNMKKTNKKQLTTTSNAPLTHESHAYCTMRDLPLKLIFPKSHIPGTTNESVCSEVSHTVRAAAKLCLLLVPVPPPYFPCCPAPLSLFPS